MASRIQFLAILVLLFLIECARSDQKCLCCSEEVNQKDLQRCSIPGIALNRSELIELKSKHLGYLCQMQYGNANFARVDKYGLTKFKHRYVDAGKCAEFFDGISDLLYWIPRSATQKYSYVWSDSSDKILFRREPSVDTTKWSIEEVYTSQYFGDPTLFVNRSSLLVIKQPSFYQLITDRTTYHFTEKKAIVDLGTFSFFNPTDNYQNYTITINITDKMEMNAISFDFAESGVDLTLVDGDDIWQGLTRAYNDDIYYYYPSSKAPMELKKHSIKKIPLTTALAPGKSISGRVFATLAYTHKQILTSIAVDGKPPQFLANGSGSFDVYTFEHVDLRFEAVKVSSRERQIFLASYIAALAGLVSTLILGCAIFTTCLVAQKRKNKECVCPKINFEWNLKRKRQFIAEKAAKAKEVVVMAGGVCGSICNCMYHQVAN